MSSTHERNEHRMLWRDDNHPESPGAGFRFFFAPAPDPGAGRGR